MNSLVKMKLEGFGVTKFMRSHASKSFFVSLHLLQIGVQILSFRGYGAVGGEMVGDPRRGESRDKGH